MGFIIGLLTFVLVLDCLMLIFLVLLQLPKKEAGAGLAFGGTATDALFGAGSGNVLTKITKYAAATFFVLAIGLGALQRTYSGNRGSQFQRKLEQAKPVATAPATSDAIPAAPATPPALVSTNALLSSTLAATNALLPSTPAEAGTNAPAP